MIAKHKKAVYFFCYDQIEDPVAYLTFNASIQLLNLEQSDIVIDGYNVFKYEDSKGHIFYYVRCKYILSHNYAHYLPLLNEHFTDFDFAGVITWHKGKNAPDKILTVHTTGDVVSGYFGSVEPLYTRNLLLAIEDKRQQLDLDDFTTLTEATHWSGIVHQGLPEWVPQYKVPIVDIEIGSTLSSWSNQVAVQVIAQSLTQVFDRSDTDLRSLLCVGGSHFEPTFTEAVLNTSTEYPIALSHILPNRWLIDGTYDHESGLEKLNTCIMSIQGGIHGIVFHSDVKGPHKAKLRVVAESLGIPMFKYKALREPHNLPLW